MTRNVYVASTDELAGKTVTVLSLGLEAKSRGMKVGYFKPIGFASSLTGEGTVVDEDVETVRKVLGLQEEREVICPFVLEREEFLGEGRNIDPANMRKKISICFEEISSNKDIVFIEGGKKIWTGSFAHLSSPRIAKELGADMLIVSHGRDDSVVDELIHAHRYCEEGGVLVLGAVINQVPGDRLQRTARVIKSFLETGGLPVLGVLPEEAGLRAMTVRRIWQALGGKLLAGEDGLDRTVQNFLVGAMTMESAMKYFRRAKDKVIITGGDRTDIILAAMEAGASALVLTGNIHPTIKILPRADDQRIPIVLVPQDTFTTLSLVRKIVGKIKPEDEKRIAIAQRLLKGRIDWGKIL